LGNILASHTCTLNTLLSFPHTGYLQMHRGLSSNHPVRWPKLTSLSSVQVCDARNDDSWHHSRVKRKQHAKITFAGMLLYIKNMVCQRCKMVVGMELEKLHLHPVNIALGEVLIEEKELPKAQLNELSAALKAAGFELIDDKRSTLIEQIKTFVIDTVHYKDEVPEKNYSVLLSQHLHHDYSYLSRLFSEVEGITIEQFIINRKIEKVKELLTYDELSLSQIAYQLGYSSTAHLSAQFKKLTGFTASQFKQMRDKNRKPLDEAGNPK